MPVGGEGSNGVELPAGAPRSSSSSQMIEPVDVAAASSQESAFDRANRLRRESFERRRAERARPLQKHDQLANDMILQHTDPEGYAAQQEEVAKKSDTRGWFHKQQDKVKAWTYNLPFHAHNSGSGTASLVKPAAFALKAFVPGAGAFSSQIDAAADSIEAGIRNRNAHKLNRAEAKEDYEKEKTDAAAARTEALAREDFEHKRDRDEFLLDTANNNLYNSPAAQKQRLRDAKLNPNLMYGGAFAQAPATAVFGRSKSNVGQRYSPRKRGTRFDPVLTHPDLALKMSNMVAQIDWLTSRLEGQKHDNVGKALDNLQKAQDIKYKKRKYNDDHVLAGANVKNLKQRGNLTESQAAAADGGHIYRAVGKEIYGYGRKFVKGIIHKVKKVTNKHFPGTF